MSKKQKQKIEIIQAPLTEHNKVMATNLVALLLMCLAFLLYGNTMWNGYTQDDAIVIYDNMYTTQGIKGIPGLLSKDTFYGFFKEAGKQNLVAGGRYRPLTPIMFAVEYQLVGKSPWLGHLLNILWFGFLALVIYKTFSLLIKDHFGELTSAWIAGVAAALFIAHPIHTEAVANIKGRDEIISLLGSMGALYYLVKKDLSGLSKYSLYAGIIFFLGLMSKENAITFLAIAPISLMVFRKKSFWQAIIAILPLIIATAVFLIIRTSILGFDTGGTPNELMNNPFIKIKGNQYIPFAASEKMATILYTLGKYIQLLFVPYQLTHDYYPRHIGIMQMSDPLVLVSVLAYMVLFFAAWYYRNKQVMITYGILFFMLSLSIVSNIVFPIGTNMSERFLFMPSVGFSLISAYLIYKVGKGNKKVLIGITSLLFLLYGIKTFTRNFVWKDDFTLFTTDVKTSNKSAKILNAAGGALVTNAEKEKDENKKKAMLEQAEVYLKQAIEIHPNYKNAWLLLGNAAFYQNKKEDARKAYESSLTIDPDFKDAKNNLAVTLRDLGRYYGETKNDLVKSEEILKEALLYNPTDTETLRLLGISYGIQGKHQQAVEVFQKVVDLEPKSAGAYLNLSNAYRYLGNEAEASRLLAISTQLDPNILNQK